MNKYKLISLFLSRCQCVFVSGLPLPVSHRPCSPASHVSSSLLSHCLWHTVSALSLLVFSSLLYHCRYHIVSALPLPVWHRIRSSAVRDSLCSPAVWDRLCSSAALHVSHRLCSSWWSLCHIVSAVRDCFCSPAALPVSHCLCFLVQFSYYKEFWRKHICTNLIHTCITLYLKYIITTRDVCDYTYVSILFGNTVPY